MNSQKLREVIALYRQEFESLNIPKARHDIREPLPLFGHEPLALAHCHQMLDQMETFVSEGRLEKCFRWLGFIQGALWALGAKNVSELKNHNRPD